MQSHNVILPPWKLAIFGPEDDQAAADKAAAAQAVADKAVADKASADRTAADKSASDKARDDKAAADKAVADKAALDKQAKDLERGSNESVEDYKRRVAELNDENKNRRRENNELKSNLTVLEKRAITGDARDALREAGAINARVTELFLSDMAEHVKIDPKTGNTTGLDKIADWKKANPEFFKADETPEAKTAREAAEKKTADAEAAGKRGNRTAASGSKGNGTGADDKTDGIPDLKTLKTPAEREAAMRNYRQTLRPGSGGGYAKASSRDRDS